VVRNSGPWLANSGICEQVSGGGCQAREGRVIAVTTAGNARLGSLADDVIELPRNHDLLLPVLTVVPLQLFAYCCAVLRGCDIDKPRNLAKSVTVE